MRKHCTLTFAIPVLLLGLSGSPAFGDTCSFTVNFAADTRDLHLTVGGKIKSVKISQGGKEIAPSSSNGTDPPKGQYNAGWAQAPGAGATKVECTGHMGGNDWGGKYWLTTDGGLHRPDVEPTNTFASIYPVFNDDFATLYAVNGFDTQPLDITSFNATWVSNFGSLHSPDWEHATGQTYSFGSSTLPAGATAFFLGTVPISGGGWLKIDGIVNGAEQITGYAATPEPVTSALIGMGLIAVSIGRRYCTSKGRRNA